MSKTGVIVALVVAILLAAAAMFLGGKGRGTPAPSGPLLAFDPARVVELRLTRSDGRFEAVKRSSVPGLWDVVLGGKGPETVWPADSGRMRAALRILSTLETDQTVTGGVVEPGAPEVRLVLDDQSQRTVRISARTLAAKVLIEVVGVPGVSGGRAAWVGADVGAMLVGTGPREWRDRSALPGIGPDVSRITLKGEKGTLSLGRVQGRWGLREPVQEAAEPDAVGRLLTVLGSILVTDFLDDGPPDRTGLDKPVAELTIESDQRDDEGKVHTASRILRVGQQADIAGKSVFADLSSGGSGGRVVMVSAEGLSGLTTDPSAYVSRRSVQTPAADVGGLIISPAGRAVRGYGRTIDGWGLMGEDGVVRYALGKADSETVPSLVSVLAQMSAETVVVGDAWPEAALGPKSALEPLANVELRSAGGAPLEKLELFVAKPPRKAGRSEVISRVGDVWRECNVDATNAAIEWIRRMP